MRLIVRLVFFFADILGVNWLFRKIYRTPWRILMYHGVSSEENAADCWTVITDEEFVWQVEYLNRHYHVQSPKALLAKDNGLPDRAVLSFDDGLLNNYAHVWPVLKEHNFEAILFVLPGLVERKKVIWADWLFWLICHQSEGLLDLSRWGLGKIHLDTNDPPKEDLVETLVEKLKRLPHITRVEILDSVDQQIGIKMKDYGPFNLMNREQLKELADSEEYAIGSHTLYHPILASMNREEQVQEIVSCLKKVAEWDLKPLPIFAYPNGRPRDYNEDSVAILKENGIAMAFSTIDGFHRSTDDPYHVKRIPIGKNTSRLEFKARLSGFYYWLKSLS